MSRDHRTVESLVRHANHFGVDQVWKTALEFGLRDADLRELDAALVEAAKKHVEGASERSSGELKVAKALLAEDQARHRAVKRAVETAHNAAKL